MSEHTPEPWYFLTQIEKSIGIPARRFTDIFKKDGTYARPARCEREADARRIVACVNACAGIETALLEDMPTGLLAKIDTKTDARADEATRLLERAHTHLTTTFRDGGKSHDEAIKAIRAFLDRPK